MYYVFLRTNWAIVGGHLLSRKPVFYLSHFLYFWWHRRRFPTTWKSDHELYTPTFRLVLVESGGFCRDVSYPPITFMSEWTTFRPNRWESSGLWSTLFPRMYPKLREWELKVSQSYKLLSEELGSIVGSPHRTFRLSTGVSRRSWIMRWSKELVLEVTVTEFPPYSEIVNVCENAYRNVN